MNGNLTPKGIAHARRLLEEFINSRDEDEFHTLMAGQEPTRHLNADDLMTVLIADAAYRTGLRSESWLAERLCDVLRSLTLPARAAPD